MRKAVVMKHSLKYLVAAALSIPTAAVVAKTPKPLVTIDLERHASPWPAAAQLQLPADVSAAIAGLADARATAEAIQSGAAGSARAEVGESPTQQLEKAEAALRAKRKAALALLRPVAKTVPQWLLLADIEAAEAQDVFDLAAESGTKAAKLNLSAVEAVCATAMAAKPDTESARQLEYAWALALEARGQGAEAAKHFRAVAQGAAEPWRSEVLYRAGSLDLAKDSANALATWSQVVAMPYLVYANYRLTVELVRAGKCAAAADAQSNLRAAPVIDGTSYVEVAAQAVAGCKVK